MVVRDRSAVRTHGRRFLVVVVVVVRGRHARSGLLPVRLLACLLALQEVLHGLVRARAVGRQMRLIWKEDGNVKKETSVTALGSGGKEMIVFEKGDFFAIYQ